MMIAGFIEPNNDNSVISIVTFVPDRVQKNLKILAQIFRPDCLDSNVWTQKMRLKK